MAGLAFNKTYTNNISKEATHDSESIFHQGILFAHDLNSKAKVFVDFYHSYKIYLNQNKLPLPNKIAFVDDGIHNLASLQTVMPNLNIAFYGYHIQSVFKFNPEIAYREEKLLTSDKVDK